MGPVLVPVSGDAFVAVDCWRPRPPRGSSVAAFFLTHAHADHMAGLHDGWSPDAVTGGGDRGGGGSGRSAPAPLPPPLFCSPATRGVLEGMGLRRLARRFQTVSPGGRVLISRKGRSAEEREEEEEGKEEKRRKRRKRRRGAAAAAEARPRRLRTVFVAGVGLALLPPFARDENGGEDEEPELVPESDSTEEESEEEEEEEEEDEEEEEEEVVATVAALDAQHCVVSFSFPPPLFSFFFFSFSPFFTFRLHLENSSLPVFRIAAQPRERKTKRNSPLPPPLSTLDSLLSLFQPSRAP